MSYDQSGAAFSKPTSRRLDIDIARGLCIAMVVMMHAALGTGEVWGDRGFMHGLVDFANPFRIPAFFVVAGLLAGGSTRWTLTRFIDRKILHFIYFYALWAGVQILLKDFIGAGFAFKNAFHEAMLALIDPYGALWFIYVLPFFYVTARLVRDIDRRLILVCALGLHLIAPHTTWMVLDEYPSKFFFFYAGVAYAKDFVKILDFSNRRAGWAIAGLCFWAVLEIIATSSNWGSWRAFAVGRLVLAMAGACAVFSAAALLARSQRACWRFGEGIAYLGENSLIIYLSFFLPMIAARLIIVKFAPSTPVGLACFIVFAIALIAPIFMARVARRLGLGWLYQRPQWARLDANLPKCASAQPLKQARIC